MKWKEKQDFSVIYRILVARAFIHPYFWSLTSNFTALGSPFVLHFVCWQLSYPDFSHLIPCRHFEKICIFVHPRWTNLDHVICCVPVSSQDPPPYWKPRRPWVRGCIHCNLSRVCPQPIWRQKAWKGLFSVCFGRHKHPGHWYQLMLLNKHIASNQSVHHLTSTNWMTLRTVCWTWYEKSNFKPISNLTTSKKKPNKQTKKKKTWQMRFDKTNTYASSSKHTN